MDIHNKYSQLEVARIIGEPIDPRRRYADVIAAIAETDTADPNEFVYYFDVLQDTDKVFTTVANGVTQQLVTPDSPVLFSFIDAATPEYYVKITDLANAKENVLARKLRTIDRSLNAYEINKVLDVMNVAAGTEGNLESLESGFKRFVFKNLVDMIDIIIDYASNNVLIAGSQVDKDIKLWDWNDDKNRSLFEALRDLDVTIMRVSGAATFQLNSVSKNALDSTRAFLVGRDTEAGRPVLFVRKRLNDIDLLGGAIKRQGEKPERLVFVSPNPVTVVSNSTRFLAIGVTGYENIVCAVTNPKAIVKFDRV